MAGLDQTEWTAITAIGTMLYTVFTAVLATFAYFAWRAANAQVKEVRGASEAALRPVLIVTEASVVLAGQTPLTSALIRNVGPGPALKVEIHFSVQPLSENRTVEFRMEVPAIPAGEPRAVREMHPQKHIVVNDGYNLDAVVAYSDVFGNRIETRYSAVRIPPGRIVNLDEPSSTAV